MRHPSLPMTRTRRAGVAALAAALWMAPSVGRGAGSIWEGIGADGNLTFTDSPQGGSFEVLIEVRKGRPRGMASIDSAVLKRNMDAFDNTIVEEALKNDLPPELVKAVVLVESGMNPKARSPKGAMGLMQLMPFTAREVGVCHPYDPEESIRGGTAYLAKMVERFAGDRRLAVAAYNAGAGNVEKARGVPAFPETRFYVDRVFKYYRYFSQERPIAAR